MNLLNIKLPRLGKQNCALLSFRLPRMNSTKLRENLVLIQSDLGYVTTLTSKIVKLTPRKFPDPVQNHENIFCTSVRENYGVYSDLAGYASYAQTCFFYVSSVGFIQYMLFMYRYLLNADEICNK